MPETARTAIVTGAESGIGAACAAALGKAGHRVAVFFFNDDKAAGRTCEVIEAGGGNAVPIQVDVSDERSVERGFDAASEAFGLPTILVNSAGLNMSGTPVVEMEAAQWRRLLATDLDGPFFTSRRFVRDCMAATKPGTIINISSIHATDVRAGGADYCAAKAGLKALTETLALEVARHGITVNAIEPGMILTPMNQRAIEDIAYRHSLEAAIPAQRAGKPEEIAGLALFLTRPEAAYINGASLTMDGGLSLMLGQGA